MVRTERLASTPDRDGMVAECVMPGLELAPDDVRGLPPPATRSPRRSTSRTCWSTGAASPYVLELMDSYVVKKELERRGRRQRRRGDRRGPRRGC